MLHSPSSREAQWIRSIDIGSRPCIGSNIHREVDGTSARDSGGEIDGSNPIGAVSPVDGVFGSSTCSTAGRSARLDGSQRHCPVPASAAAVSVRS
jgi:hypothetical protein